MYKNNYLHFNTYYDNSILRNVLNILNIEGIEFKTVDKSNQRNFKVPMSTYIEVDILIIENEFEKAEKSLKDFTE